MLSLKVASELMQYRLGSKPFLGSMADGDLASLRSYWLNLHKNATDKNRPLQLPSLALIVHEIKPDGAACEKNFSILNRYQSPVRNQLLSRKTTAMTALMMHHGRRDKVR